MKAPPKALPPRIRASGKQSGGIAFPRGEGDMKAPSKAFPQGFGRPGSSPAGLPFPVGKAI